MRRVTFRNRDIEIVGNLHLPDDFREDGRYPAVVLTTPGSSVKEQIGDIYAERLARRGFVALTFDPAYQGESGGSPATSRIRRRRSRTSTAPSTI